MSQTSALTFTRKKQAEKQGANPPKRIFVLENHEALWQAVAFVLDRERDFAAVRGQADTNEKAR